MGSLFFPNNKLLFRFKAPEVQKKTFACNAESKILSVKQKEFINVHVITASL